MVGKHHEYRAMAECERELWWYRSLHGLTLQKIQQYNRVPDPFILDAGCGTGGMLSVLKENGFTNIAGFDLSSDAIQYARTNFQFDVRLLNIIDCDKYDAQSFDIIICNDVLCLLTDNHAGTALRKLTSLLKPGGYIFMNLPAGNAFRGTHDKAVGILKRYSAKSVVELISGVVEMKEYLFWPFLVSPLIYGVRLFQRLKIRFSGNENFSSDVTLPPGPVNKFLFFLTRGENAVLRRKPWGSSVFVVLQKAG